MAVEHALFLSQLLWPEMTAVVRFLTLQGKFNEAEPLYRRALAISENALGPDHPIVATTLKKWAGLLENQVRPRRVFWGSFKSSWSSRGCQFD